MDEIAHNIFIEKGCPGVVSSVIKLSQGLLIIDAPMRADDRQAWQKQLGDLGGGKGRLMVLLDTHTDRLYGTQMIEFPILAHENTLKIIRELPSTQRVSEKQDASDPETYDLPQSVRWAVPDLTFSNQVAIHWDEHPVVVTHQPGAHLAGSWVRYDPAKVIFVGDSVVIKQPPYLGWCDLDRWIDELNELCSDTYKGFKIIGGRNGVVQQRSIVKMIELLSAVKTFVFEASAVENPESGLDQFALKLMREINYDRDLKEHYMSRLVRGLKQLLQRNTAAKLET
jgi:glyoxylase-like metal-dependent hydrolase (beta-lactamase superfamily II)